MHSRLAYSPTITIIAVQAATIRLPRLCKLVGFPVRKGMRNGFADDWSRLIQPLLQLAHTQRTRRL
jgi:hypothetical protein